MVHTNVCRVSNRISSGINYCYNTVLIRFKATLKNNYVLKVLFVRVMHKQNETDSN